MGQRYNRVTLPLELIEMISKEVLDYKTYISFHSTCRLLASKNYYCKKEIDRLLERNSNDSEIKSFEYILKNTEGFHMMRKIGFIVETFEGFIKRQQKIQYYLYTLLLIDLPEYMYPPPLQAIKSAYWYIFRIHPGWILSLKIRGRKEDIYPFNQLIEGSDRRYDLVIRYNWKQ